MPLKLRHTLLAGFAAVAAFTTLLAVGMATVGTIVASAAMQEHAVGVGVAKDVIGEIERTMRSLSDKATPICNEDMLREWREVNFNSTYISDIAVLNENNLVMCSTTLGLHPFPLPAFRPEFEFVVANHSYATSRYGANYFGTQRDVVTVVRTGRFQVTVAPFAVARMATDKFSVVGLIRHNDSHVTALRETDIERGVEAVAKAYMQDPSQWRRNDVEFNWENLSWEARSWVEPTPYVYFTTSPLFNLSAMRQEYWAILITLGSLIAVLVYQTTRIWLVGRSSMQRRIRKLLNDSNITCVYQPIVQLDTGRIIGCEVLVRLKDGNRLLSPDQFLPAVVHNKLTWVLDAAVIRTSLQALAREIPPSMPLKVSINLFPENIIASRLHTLLHDELRIQSSPALKLSFEIIEQDYRDSIMEEIAVLKAQGYQISVDDFGTGYSNLGSIRKMQPHFLKVDRSFVHDMESATVRSTLIPEIVAIGRAAGAAVIAEGIENEKQRRAILAMGVEFGQGYLFGKPMPLGDFMDLLRAQESFKAQLDLEISEWLEPADLEA